MPQTVMHFQARLDTALYNALVNWAKSERISVNALIVGIIEMALEQRDPRRIRDET